MNNKLFFDYGPVWSKKCHDDEYLASRNVPPPDSITCGQMITQNFFSHNETEDYSVNDSAKLEEPEVKTRKYTSKKFPLNFDTSATPFLNQPDYEQQLHGNRNKRYLNLLSSYELNNVNHLVYSEYDGESNVLKISSLNELDESKGEVVLSSTQFISEFNVLHQVQADVINNIPYILLIVDDTVSFLRVSEEGFNLCCVETKDITSSCLNKDLSNCFSFTKEATINLFDVEKEKVMWCCPLNNASYKTKKFTQCEFGNNPFNICVSCESQITLADTRTAENHKKRNLFEIDKFSTYLYSDKEIISSCKHTQDSPLFYVACSNTLLLMDERYCKYPVLNWYHMIKGRPSHIQCFKRNDIDFVVMAEPYKSQFCFTSLQSDNSEYPEVHSLSTPIHKNIVKDTILFAKKHEIALSDLTEKQICSPLVGLSIFPFSFGHTVVFQNNYGNLFYFNCYDRKSKRNFISKETAIKNLKTYEKFVQKKMRKDHLKKSAKGKYLDGFKTTSCFRYQHTSIKRGENWNKFIWDLTSLTNYCSYSNFYSKNENQRDPSDPSFFSDKDQNNLSAEYIKNCSDSMSQKLLSTWSSNFSDFSSLDVPTPKITLSDLFCYQSCPYFVDNEDAGEIPMLNKEIKSESISSTNNLFNDGNITNDVEDTESISDRADNKSTKKSLCLSATNNSGGISDSSTDNHRRKKTDNHRRKKRLSLLDTKKSKKKIKMDGF